MSFESILSLCSFSHKEKSKQNIKTTPVIYGLSSPRIGVLKVSQSPPR